MNNLEKYIKEIYIGNVKLKNNVFLAPMAGVTDLPFRSICHKYGPALMYTEMVSAKALVYNDEKTEQMLTSLKDERPFAAQIFGSDEEDIKSAVIKINNMENIDIIDINMGCPVPKITKNGEGSALLKDLTKVKKIIEAAVSVSKKPITIKTRIGYNRENLTAVEVAKIAEVCGAKAITIHGRTKEQMYTGIADLEAIKKVKESVSIPVIGNGDIVDRLSAERMFEVTNVDAIMIGRGSLGNPWIFGEILNNIDVSKITMKEKYETILEHMKLASEYYGEKRAILEMRKHIAWYLKGLKGSTIIKNKINTETSEVNIERTLKEYFNSLASK